MRRASGNRASRRPLRQGSPRGEHLLDVRVRRSTATRRRRHHTLRLLFGATLWIGLIAGTCFGFRAIVNKFFLQNPEYNLRIVDTELDGLMPRGEAIRLAGLKFGENIFRVDLAAAERGLRQIDQIDTVTIRRDWPDRIAIRITKRVPVAWLSQAGTGDLSTDHTLLLDAQGRTIKPFRVEPEYWHLPVIYVSDPVLVRERDPLILADLRAALDLIAECARRKDSLLDIQSIDITKGYALEVVDADKARITFAPNDPAAQLARLQKLLENFRDTGRRVESVNLIPKKYIPVRFLLASTQDAKPINNRNPEETR